MRAHASSRARSRWSKKETAELIRRAEAHVSGECRPHRSKNKIAVLIRRAETAIRDGCRPRFSKKEIAMLADRAVRLHEICLEGEAAEKEIRAMLMEADRPDLARKFLSAPQALKDLAGLLWRNAALVTFSRRPPEELVSSVQYLENFTLERRPGQNSFEWTRIGIDNAADTFCGCGSRKRGLI